MIFPPGLALDDEAMQEALDRARELSARGPRLEAELELIVAAAGYTLGDVRGPVRTREVVDMRRVLAAFLTARGLSESAAGRLLNRDSTTVRNLLGKRKRKGV